MRRPEIKNPPLGRQFVRDLAESSEGLSESSSGHFPIASTGSDLAESKVDPPDRLHSAGLVSTPQDGGEIVPTLPIIDDSIYHDLADGDTSVQLDSQGLGRANNRKNVRDGSVGISASSKKIEFDLDPR